MPEPRRTKPAGQYPAAAVEAAPHGVILRYKPSESSQERSMQIDGETARRLLRPEMMPETKQED